MKFKNKIYALFILFFYLSCNNNTNKNCNLNKGIVFSIDSLIYYSQCVKEAVLSKELINRTIPESINFSQLTSLKLEKVSMPNKENFYSCLMRCDSLRDVYFTSAIDGQIPNEIYKLKQIKKLYLKSDSIIKLPNSLFEMSNLEELILEGRFEFESIKFNKLNNIKTLGLINSNLFDLPEFVYNITTLENIYLSFNPIHSINPKIKNLRNLKTLDISSTPIEKEEWDRYKLHRSSELFKAIKQLCNDCEIRSNIQ